MPQSLTQIYLHIIFSTKDRIKLIDDSIAGDLYAYIGGICKKSDCIPLKVGGYYDHIHILCKMSKRITLIDLLKETKRSSSKWIKTKGDRYARFYWQRGYAAFSINPTQVNAVSGYIANQKGHHRKKSFKEECRVFFKKYGVDYDERFVWD